MKTTYTDDRGFITELEDGIQFIFSKKGSRRASHFHLTSGHKCILTRGSMTYYERGAGSSEVPVKIELRPHSIVETFPKMEHLMVFNEDSDMVCIRTGGSYTHEEYEADIVRFNHDLEKIHDNRT